MLSSLISIIIPVYNRANLLPETLDSILAQTYKNWECIIVDDGSTDNTADVILEYVNRDKRFKLYKRPNKKLKGANACRNFGFLESKGDFIQFFDSDDLMHKNLLSKKVKVLEESMSIDYVICRFNTFIKNKESKVLDTSNEVKNIYQDYILGRVSIFTFSVMWRRDVIAHSPLFDEELQQFQDLDLYSKIIFENRNFKLLDEVLIFLRRENDSITTVDNKLDIKTDSFLKVKEHIINRTPKEEPITLSVIKSVLGVMRYKMAARDYLSSDKCLDFVTKHSDKLTFVKKVSFYKIRVFYKVFKAMKTGDTKFKNFIKL